jgi:chromatin remodeling complex protein RSC6
MNETILGDFKQLSDMIYQMKNSITILQNQVKLMEKEKNKKIKRLEKELQKRKERRSREPSGFAKPTKISNKLCEFLNKPPGSEVARTEVTQHLISYIKKHNLQNKNNKSFINPDEKLSELLSVDSADNITYFNIQGFMNQHFIKENNEKMLTKN